MNQYFSVALFLSTLVLGSNSFADISTTADTSIQSKITQAEADALKQLQQRLPQAPKEDSQNNIANAGNTAGLPTTASTVPNPAATAQTAPGPTTSAPQNPWVKSNPWETQAKQNPWANQTAPAQNGASAYSSGTLPPPPNIFAPNQTNSATTTTPTAPNYSSSTVKN